VSVLTKRKRIFNQAEEQDKERINDVPGKKEKIFMTSEAIEVIEYWNSKGIVNHRTDNQSLAGFLPRFLRKYDINDIKTAIDNYATVYFDEEYKPWPEYTPYKWTLHGFLLQDKYVCEFMPDGQKWVNYCFYKEKNAKAKQKLQPQMQLIPIEIQPIPVNSPLEELYRSCIDTLRSMEYKEYIHTEHWQHFRKEAIKHFNCTCQLCDARDDTLDVHHKTYANRGRETFNDVILLCRHCHDLYHHNKDQCTCPRCSGEEGEHLL
jgi:hypothetical protein